MLPIDAFLSAQSVILTKRSVGTFRSTPEVSALAAKPKGLKSRILRKDLANIFKRLCEMLRFTQHDTREW